MILCSDAPDQQLVSFSSLPPFIGCHSVEKGTTEESVLMTQNVDSELQTEVEIQSKSTLTMYSV